MNDQDFETIKVHSVDGVGVVTLHRPERRNAFVPRMWLEMSTAFAAMDVDESIRAVVVTGSGDHFCVGADMDGGKDTFRDRLGQRSELVSSMKAPRAKPWEMATPVIGAINGSAIGVGATLPLQWDIRVAAEDAKIAFAFVLRGAVPEANSHWLLPRLIGASRASELLLTGRTITGREAADIGLVSRAVPAADVLEVALDIGRQIARNVAPTSAALVKRLLNDGMEQPDRLAAHRRENEAFRWVVRQPDAREGVVSFVEKRPPAWTGSKHARPSVEPSTVPESAPPTDAERIALQRATIDQHMAGESEHDWPAVLATFVQDDRAFWDAVPVGTRHQGIDAVRRFYEAQEATFPNAHVTVTRAYDVPGVSVREVTISGTHVGTVEGIPATGAAYSFDAVGVYVFADGAESGLLLGERVYYDAGTVAQQLAGAPDAVRSLSLASRAD